MATITPSPSLDGRCTFTLAPYTCSSCNDTDTTLSCAQNAGVNAETASYLNFDLSSLPAGATITAASLYLRCTSRTTSRGYSPTTYVNTSTENQDYGASLDCSDVSGSFTTQATNTNISATGDYNISFSSPGSLPTTGKVAVRVYPAFSPAPTGSQNATLLFASQDHATSSWRPVLTVTYTTSSLKDPITVGFIPFPR